MSGDNLLLPPAERGVVEVCPQAAHHARPVQQEPGEGQSSPPLLAITSQYEEDVDTDGEDDAPSHHIQPLVRDLHLDTTLFVMNQVRWKMALHLLPGPSCETLPASICQHNTMSCQLFGLYEMFSKLLHRWLEFSIFWDFFSFYQDFSQDFNISSNGLMLI